MLELFDTRNEAFQVHISRMMKERKPARVIGANGCQRSGVCCWRQPPRLTSEDLCRLAEAAHISESEFFRTMCVVDDPLGTLAPILRRHHQNKMAGTYISDDETYSLESPCIYLDDEERSCSVHAIKPRECAEMGCWMSKYNDPFEAWSREALVALGWDGVRA